MRRQATTEKALVDLRLLASGTVKIIIAWHVSLHFSNTYDENTWLV
jgi:hypothetical protein